VLAAARRFDDLGVAEQPIPVPAPVEATVRALRPADLPTPTAVDRDEEDQHTDRGPATRAVTAFARDDSGTSRPTAHRA
jgi:DNA recombination protein RmuC